ncbi:MAG: phage holin family protein [Eggerthellaceae bacterium]|nr:phage holin family protein [Eggerthellaceae bacterium]
MNFFLRWLGCAIAVGCAVWLIPGIGVIGNVATWIPIVFVALFLSLINLSIKPIMQIISLPISILTLGIFALIVNVAMLYLANWLSTGILGMGLVITSFGSAFLASIIISIVSMIVNGITGTD